MAEQDPKQPENEVQDEQTANPEAQLETAEEVAAAEAADAGAEGDTEASLDDELSQLQEDLLTARDAALRAQADAQNVKRRAEQDVEKARKFALERFASD